MNNYQTNEMHIYEELMTFAEKIGKGRNACTLVKAKSMCADVSRDLTSIRKRLSILRKNEEEYSRSGSAQWFLDNWYLAENTAQGAYRRFKYSPKLPADDKGRLVLTAIADDFISFTAGRFDEKLTAAFLFGLQKSYPLTEDELYMFVPAVCRALIKYLASLSKDEKTFADNGFEKTYGDVFSSLRFADNYDLSEILEKSNLTERILSQDKVYTQMDDATRHLYRTELSKLARKEKISEQSAAEKVIGLSKKNGKHVGIYIFEEPLGKTNKEKSGGGYICAVVLPTLFISIFLGFTSGNVMLFLLSLVPISEIVKNIADYIILKSVPPKHLPRLELKEGIPNNAKTLCAVSIMLSNEKSIDASIENIKNMSITNRDSGKNLFFALLADLPESDIEVREGESQLVAYAAEKIQNLNKSDDRFFLFVRKKTFNEKSNRYMGYERKRGAICALVNYLSGTQNELYCFGGNGEKLENTRYIIALDSDTKMCAGMAKELVGAALHPLNIPVVDKERKRVIKGAGIIQPKISVSLSAVSKSVFTTIFAGLGGIDPYGSLVSDVYQDLYGYGGFNGKGLINIPVFKMCLEEAFPDNTVLSHDILEGAYVKTKYAGDIEFTDGYPYKVLAYYSRMHRWVRGDWQNCIWLGKYIRDKKSIRQINPISQLDKWKIFDNMRRSLVPVITLISVLSGVLIADPVYAVAAAVAVLSYMSGVIMTSAELIVRRAPENKARYYSPIIFGPKAMILQTFFRLIFLPYEGYICLSAILTALYRMNISHKNMLAWVTAADSERKSASDIFGHYFKMWPNIFFALISLISRSVIKWPVLLFWFFGPAAAYFISREKTENKQMPFETRQFLQSQAEEIWRFFEDTLTEDNNFLPPDNVQIEPPVGTAHRTSPTNIGLSLLSCLAAADLGIIDRTEAYDRVEKIITTLEKMKKWKGHLYNWYDTRSLKVLQPPYVSTVDSGNLLGCLIALKEELIKNGKVDLCLRAAALIENMDFIPLYDKKADLFYIGFDEKENKPTQNHYDLMSSEARQTSYLAVSRGIVPKKHWQKLSRSLVSDNGYRGMVSWTGTMFEYLMPNLLLPCPKNSLVYESSRFCLYEQKKRTGGRMPWGISESCFYDYDASMNYKYAPHGVQKLALKRNMDETMVISPYSTFLGLTVSYEDAVKNLRELEKAGGKGKYGFYEALDYTKERCERKTPQIVKTYMAHHLGMSLLAISNVLEGDIMRKRFMSDDNSGAYSELLEERIPVGETVLKQPKKDIPDRPGKAKRGTESMNITKIDYKNPLIFPVSNGSYSVLVSETGQTDSKWNGVSITRSAEDRFHGGGIDFKLDINGKVYSSQPVTSDRYHGFSASYDGSGAMICFEDEEISIKQEIKVFTGEIGERRKITIDYKGKIPVSANLYSYFEPVLQRERDFLSHPGFSKQQLEFEKKNGAVLIDRRGDDGKSVLSVCFISDGDLKISTSRTKTYGRRDPFLHVPDNFEEHNDRCSPECCVASLMNFELRPGMKLEVNYALAAGFDREGVYESAVRILNSTDTGSRITERENAESISCFLSKLVYGETKTRQYSYEPSRYVPKNELWKFSISGDDPIVVYECGKENIGDLKMLLLMKKLTKEAGVNADFVIMAKDGCSKSEIYEKAKEVGMFDIITSHGTYLLNYSEETKIIYDLCSFIADDSAFNISERNGVKPRYAKRNKCEKEEELKYTFDENSEFEFKLCGQLPPTPWCNVIAGENFGTLVAETGGGFMWHVNSHENKINSWKNDRFFYTDTEKIEVVINGVRYSVFAAEDGCECSVRYGFGYAVWKKQIERVFIETTVFTACDKNIKLIMIKAENLPKDAKLRYYSDLIMADRITDSKYVVTDYHDGCINAYNRVNDRFSGFPYSFLSSSGFSGFTTNKVSWMFDELDGSVGTGGEACIGAEVPFRGCHVFSMGCDSKEELLRLLKIKECESELEKNKKYWRNLVARTTVTTGNERIDNFISGWGMYQTIACRLFARTSMYQNGGAFGFRDQLQDAVSALHTDPNILAEQILRCCHHQFEEGDVQHWWHPSGGNNEGTSPGVRTLCSDDLLWLPYALCRYCEATGDLSITDTEVYYITSDLITGDDTVRYEVPKKSNIKESVLDHAQRACEQVIKRGFGSHGLCKILGGDWNDGMDYVGIKGHGESVWLTWFASIVFGKMAHLLDEVGLDVKSREYRQAAKAMKDAAEKTFDGGWYLRGYFDNGKPLGMSGNDECEIDSISQSFAQFAGADCFETKTALFSAYNKLFDKELGLVKLFDPPFDKGEDKPGYIKRYCPGFRENGGQYTHAALWLAKALFEAGEPDSGWAILRGILPERQDIPGYMAEPYVVAADVYSNEANPKRAGWTWYTGSAGWYYSVLTENMLGLKLRKGRLYIEPNLPSEIKRYTAVYKSGNMTLDIAVIVDESAEITVNGKLYDPEGYPVRENEKFSLNAGKI